jgi:lipopolysaccharide/colanic/teichoic acid biosynthesis glycosyltransferase
MAKIRTDLPIVRSNLYTRYGKRIFDILFSVIGILFLSPILLLIAILELFFHGRPILYVDKRPGLNGEIFNLYKFRSMTNVSDLAGVVLHSSERITPFGRFLRRTSLDELASLFNILNGTMSVIGPRPLMVDYLPLYNERHKYRHSVKPGLACWKLDGGDQLNPTTWTWNDQFENDIFYVENISLWLDIRMIMKTIRIVFSSSEMRTNSDRVKFDGTNLLETRSRSQMLEDNATTDVPSV